MGETQTENQKASRVQVRLPDTLMRQVELRTGPHGLYADSSDYIRDLIRKDLQSEPSLNDQLAVIWQHLLPGSQADESEFVSTTREEAKASGRVFAAEQLANKNP
jgi:antitoxin ParD1/3/4|tara:strand:- start:15497 stop:15811 length:315 start_codon:yes stop_codon:yes gene_type:complete